MEIICVNHILNKVDFALLFYLVHGPFYFSSEQSTIGQDHICCCLVSKSCLNLCDPWTVAHQAPLSMGFPRKEYWSGLPGILPTQGLNSHLVLGRRFFTTEPHGKPGPLISSVQSLTHVELFATPWIAACQDSLSITNSQSLRKLMSIELVMPSNHLILCHPVLLLPSIFPSIRVFSKESVLHIRWPKYWSFSFSISPSNEYSGLISLRWTGWISLQSKGLSRVFPNTTVQKHQFFSSQLSL